MKKYEMETLDLEGAFIIHSNPFKDSRGVFLKHFETEYLKELGIDFQVSEIFYSVSKRNVLRGIHFQTVNPQAKIVFVSRGSVYDVIVDLRKESPTFGKWCGVTLSEENYKSIYIPQGYGHAFLALEDNTVMHYICHGEYDQASDTGIRYDDPDIGIVWPVSQNELNVSEKDLGLCSFREYIKNLK